MLAVLSFTPLAHAYGPANWQAAFSGTFVNPGSGNSGFWGWCDFAGGTGSPATSGSAADCEVSQYFGPSHGFQVVVSIQGTAWDEETCTFRPCLTTSDFFITAGAVTLAGPFAVQITSSGPPPPGSGCTVKGTTATCPIPFLEAVGFYNPDTGVPTVSGHYNLNSFLNHSGEFQIQVVQLS